MTALRRWSAAKKVSDRERDVRIKGWRRDRSCYHRIGRVSYFITATQMYIDKPYKRIWRPILGDTSSVRDYLLDPVYAPGREHLTHAYRLLELELLELFDYIEPADRNLATFSHQLYQILLRACTEFETNATAILGDNGYNPLDKHGKPRTNWRMDLDYWKINAACRLSEYSVKLPVWRGQAAIRTPFAAWGGAAYAPLPWYQAYNAVKHDRFAQFDSANLENVLDAVAAVLIVLCAQFHVYAFSIYSPIMSYVEDNGYLCSPGRVLEVCPARWVNPVDIYLFEWKQLKKDPNPLQNYQF